MAENTSRGIQKTSSYTRFNSMRGNRKVSERHIRSLVNSISKRNLLAANPILVDDAMNVIDGQHRLEAARKLNVPIYYIVIEGGADLSDVQLINTAQKTWTLEDYMQSYIEMGNQHYIDLQVFVEKWNLPISAGVRLLANEGVSDLGRFKKGEFVVENELRALEVMQMVQVFKPYITNRIRRSREFLNAVSTIVSRDIVTKDQIQERLDAYGKRLYQVDSVKEYLRQIEDAYNFYKKVQTRFY